MKINKLFLPLFALLLLLSSCGEAKIETITSTSPEGNRTITVSGSKASPLAPIMVDMLFEVENGKVEFATELAATQLTSENCEVVWSSNKEGYIEMTMSDGVKKYVDFIATPDTVHVINRLYN